MNIIRKIDDCCYALGFLYEGAYVCDRNKIDPDSFEILSADEIGSGRIGIIAKDKNSAIFIEAEVTYKGR